MEPRADTLNRAVTLECLCVNHAAISLIPPFRICTDVSELFAFRHGEPAGWPVFPCQGRAWGWRQVPAIWLPEEECRRNGEAGSGARVRVMRRQTPACQPISQSCYFMWPHILRICLKSGSRVYGFLAVAFGEALWQTDFRPQLGHAVRGWEQHRRVHTSHYLRSIV